MTLFAYVLVYSGLTALCLAMNRHHRQVRKGPRRKAVCISLRVSGWLILAASLLLACLSASSWSIAAVGWVGALSIAALVLVALLPWAPRLVGKLALAAPPIGLLGSLIA